MTSPASDANVAPGRVRVFGGVLATDRSLPGLPLEPTSSAGPLPLWNLRTEEAATDAVPHSAGAHISGRLDYSSGVSVTLARRDAVTEVAFSDTGRFDIRDTGGSIVHHAPVGVDRAAVALDLIGVVLPLALHASGAWCVHASAVRTASGVIAFVAPRGTGKSTLAAACVHAGCTLVADDVVVLRSNSNGITVTPVGVPLRLRAETAVAVGVTAGHEDGWGKVRVEGHVAVGEAPLSAIYLLQPMTADAAIERAPRAPRAAALALLAHGKVTTLLGGESAGDALTRCVTLAQSAHVFDLAIPRDLARVHEVADVLLSWHAGAAHHDPSAS